MNWGSLFFSADGRIGQKDFWLAAVILFVFGVLIHAAVVIGTLVWLLSTYCWICIYSKRLHDIGRSGWTQILPWVLGLFLPDPWRVRLDHVHPWGALHRASALRRRDGARGDGHRGGRVRPFRSGSFSVSPVVGPDSRSGGTEPLWSGTGCAAVRPSSLRAAVTASGERPSSPPAPRPGRSGLRSGRKPEASMRRTD